MGRYFYFQRICDWCVYSSRNFDFSFSLGRFPFYTILFHQFYWLLLNRTSSYLSSHWRPTTRLILFRQYSICWQTSNSIVTYRRVGAFGFIRTERLFISKTGSVICWSYCNSLCQTIHEAMPNIPLSVLRALFENVGHDQSRLLVEVQRGSVYFALIHTAHCSLYEPSKWPMLATSIPLAQW